MSIGTAERPINIKDLILDEPSPERELPFDPEKDITEEDWEKIITEIDHLRQSDSYERQKDFISRIARVKLLSVHRMEMLQLTEDDWQKAQSVLNYLIDGMTPRGEQGYSRNTITDYLSVVQSVKVLFPDRIIVDADTYLSEIHHALNHAYSLDPFAVVVKILFPRRFTTLFGTHDIVMGHLMRRRAAVGRTLMEAQKEDRWGGFCINAANMKILSLGEGRKELVIDIDQNAWSGMLRLLENSEGGGHFEWGHFLDYAVSMKILAAEEVRITDKGLEITMRKPRTDFAPPTPPLPEVRRF